MNKELSNFAARLREALSSSVAAEATRLKFLEPAGGITSPIESEPPHVGSYDNHFNSFALDLFALQFQHNPAYQTICRARGVTPEIVEHWTQIPAVPTTAFKELELSCIPGGERTAVFHSSGTTEQKPSRHFHCAESLALYEMSSWNWFERNVLSDLRFTICDLRLVCLTPHPAESPRSSLVHMFETVRRKLGAPDSAFVGHIDADAAWTLDFAAVLAALNSSLATRHPSLILGTAFSFVHLLDFLAEHNLRFNLPAGSRVMETGGYKKRSRSMPKAELHALISERLGVSRENVICEYGMSELSSQAYDGGAALPRSRGRAAARPYRAFHFPPWARAQIVSPETGREVADGETGLIRVFDLANVFSVAAVQTEDLAIRRGDGFELIGRVALAEPRGCSLMMHEPLTPALSPQNGERVAEGRMRGQFQSR